MRIEDDIAAGIGLCTLAQAVCCAQTRRTSGKTVPGRRVPADRGNRRRSRGGGASASSSCWAPARAYGLVVDGQPGIAATRTTFACIEGLTGVQPARAGACVRVAGSEDNKAAGRVGVAVVPAVGPAVAGNCKVWARFRVVAEFGNEGSCTA